VLDATTTKKNRFIKLFCHIHAMLSSHRTVQYNTQQESAWPEFVMGYQILLGAGSGWPLDRLFNRHTGMSELTYITIGVTVRCTSEKRDR
jgi:hypothetical protein